MENSIFDYITANVLAAYWDERLAEQNKVPDLSEVLFPARKQLGLDLSFIKGSKGLPIELNLSAFDARAIKRDRIGFQEVSTSMPFFKNSMSIDEKLRQQLLTILNSGNTRFIETILRRIFDDQMTLLEGAAAVREKMAMQLISTGTIAMANNGQEYLYNYGLDTSQKPTATTKWDTTSADILGDITKWQDSREDAGYGRPTRAITSRKVLRNIANNTNIKNTLYVFANGQVNLNEQAVRNYIYDQTGVTIQVYDKSYISASGTKTRYIPDDLFILLPEGPLGEMVYGTTPEEADLMSSNAANVAIVDTGVAITTSEQVDPVNVTTKVSQIVMPSFEAADEIVIADVL